MAASSEACLGEKTLESGQSKNDRAVSDLMCNIAIADITKVGVDDFVKQITLIDMSYFAAIKRSEFLSLKWNGRDKKIYAPNIVESTRWFNQLNFWVQKEILKYPAVNKRTEMLSYFIKLAKRLVEVNNLYSAMSIVSALQVECIYRLRLTWSGLGHRERASYRRLEELFGQQDNCRLLREHTAAMRLPGIPYLGLYLSDLIYTNVAHPRINGQPTTVWVTKLNTIVDAIAHFQQSRFPYQVNESIRAYLLAQSYIEELQKFLEDANFKMSLHLEPPRIIEASPPPTSLSLMAHSATATNGHNTDGSRRGSSATARAVAGTSCKTAPLFVTLAAGYASDQESVPNKKAALPTKPLFGLKSSGLASGKTMVGGDGGTETEVDAETVSCSTVSTKNSSALKPSIPPNPVELLECSLSLTASPSATTSTVVKGCIANPTCLLKTNKECSVDKASELCANSCSDVIISSSSRPQRETATHDQEVQVPHPDTGDSLTSGPASLTCLLCGRQKTQQALQSDLNITTVTTPSHSEAVFSDSSSQSDKESTLAAASVEPPITPISSPRRKSPLAQGNDIYSALMAVANQTLPRGLNNGATESHSDSGTFFGSPRSKEDISQWPPTTFPFITALRPACVLCEGPVNRKTVGRLIPPGLEQITSTVMSSSTYSEDCFSSPCPGSTTPASPSSLTPQPQQRHSRNASWKSFWTALIVMEGWVSAYMVYFDAVAKKPYRREDFVTGRCLIQPFKRCLINGNGVECPPCVGLARHRNGTVDETSFLLTHPELHKTYRLRPIIRCSDASAEVIGGGGGVTPLTPTSHRCHSRLLFTLSRKNSTANTPTHTPPPSVSLRGRGASAPMLAAAATTTPTSPGQSTRPMPTVEDWLHALQTTLDHLQ